MLKRPTSSSRRRGSKEINLPLVPIIDTMVTLIGFLLFTMSFLSLVTIESPFPTASTADVKEKLKEKPLQLTLSLNPQEAEVWSPFDRIASKRIPNIAPGQPDIPAIHAALVEVKQKFPTESRVVLVPFAGASYDTLIVAMDSIRLLEATDPPIFVKNPATGNDEPAKALFPEVIFGNLLGDT
jgi:biopolymer transport protein TolR